MNFTLTGTLNTNANSEFDSIVLQTRVLATIDEVNFAPDSETMPEGLIHTNSTFTDASTAVSAMVFVTDDLRGKALTAEDLGKYNLIYENGKIFGQYAARIPEPATASLSLFALLGLLLRRRRK